MVLNFQTGFCKQCGLDQIVSSLLEELCSERNSLIRVYTVCYSICIIWRYNTRIEPLSLNLRVFTVNILEY